MTLVAGFVVIVGGSMALEQSGLTGLNAGTAG
jgi:hypothetical protein